MWLTNERCTLNTGLTFLEVHGPDGQEFEVDLTKDRLTIGRLRDFNDVALEPDPQQLVTRKGHCTVEYDTDGWWVVDNASVNGTFLEREQRVEMVGGRASLADGDVIRILGRLAEQGEALYWKLTFRDPLKTQPAVATRRIVYLEYDWIQAKLFRVDGPKRLEIEGLRPQEHKLVRYMARRNRENGDVPVMCTYEELIKAIWDEDAYGHAEAEITRLIWELRQKIEFDPKEPRFLQTVPGFGYRLATCPLTA
jgi:hypothetical protein